MKPFWQTAITPMKHPSEAKSITRKFDRKKDIYFMWLRKNLIQTQKKRCRMNEQRFLL
jgi:hypothetical protein